MNGKKMANEAATNGKRTAKPMKASCILFRFVAAWLAIILQLHLPLVSASFEFFFRSFAVRCHFVWCLLPVHLPFVVASFSRRLPFVAVLFAEAKRGGTRKDRGSGKLSKFDRYRIYGICCVCNTFYWIYLAAKRTSLFGSEAPLGYRENALRRQTLLFTSTT